MVRAAITFLILLLSTAAFAITPNGTCVASSSSCTFSATATGDLKIIMAYDSGGATAPTLPSGWTSINSGTVSGTGAAGFRIGCNVSSSSSDTSSGTWTNATIIGGYAITGTSATTTAACATVGIGATSGSITKSLTTETCPALTLHVTRGTSWVACFSESTSFTPCVATGMTSRANAGTGPGARAMDSNGGVTSWSAATCSMSGSTTMATEGLEITAPVTCNHALVEVDAGCS